MKDYKMKKISLCCDCGHNFEIDMDGLDFQWEIVETHDREGMGVERLYEAVCIVECPACNKQITLTIQKWEYPEGDFALPEVQAEGAKVL